MNDDESRLLAQIIKPQSCNSLRNIKLSNNDDEKREWLERQVMVEMAIIFPNVHNKWINEVRNNNKK